MKEITDVRQPLVEGLFYPGNREDLKKEVHRLLGESRTQPGDYNTLVLPHGGWDYTGPFLADGFKAVSEKSFTRVVIIGSVHREFTDRVILPEARSFLISGKEIKTDREAIKALKKEVKKLQISNTPHMEEHSLESVLPFISVLWPEARIVPILLGKTIISLVRTLKNGVEMLRDENTLVIVSTNFSTYDRESRAEEAGKSGVDLFLKGQMSELVELSRTNKIDICGAGALASLLLEDSRCEKKVLRQGLSNTSPDKKENAAYYASICWNKE